MFASAAQCATRCSSHFCAMIPYVYGCISQCTKSTETNILIDKFRFHLLLRWTDVFKKGTLYCRRNGDSHPLMRKPGFRLRVPTYWWWVHPFDGERNFFEKSAVILFHCLSMIFVAVGTCEVDVLVHVAMGSHMYKGRFPVRR